MEFQSLLGAGKKSRRWLNLMEELKNILFRGGLKFKDRGGGPGAPEDTLVYYRTSLVLHIFM